MEKKSYYIPFTDIPEITGIKQDIFSKKTIKTVIEKFKSIKHLADYLIEVYTSRESYKSLTPGQKRLLKNSLNSLLQMIVLKNTEAKTSILLTLLVKSSGYIDKVQKVGPMGVELLKTDIIPELIQIINDLEQNTESTIDDNSSVETL